MESLQNFMYFKEEVGRLLKPCIRLLQKFQQEEDIPEDWAKSTLVQIYQIKVDPQDCKNYRGISLQSLPGKVFAKLIPNRMKQYVQSALGEEQTGSDCKKKHN